ncbi:E3 ubiquitin-protein ligase TRAIP-like isoform X2 [Chironomus tepperi]
MERKKDCPQCRQKCTEKSIFRIYFNTTNLDSSLNSANLVHTVDNLTFKIREQDISLRNLEEEKKKLEENLHTKEKKIKSLDASVSHFNQVISTIKHERDMLINQRMNYKAIEAENLELKAKLNLLQIVESIMTASQKEIDDIMRQNLSSKDLTMMLGALRRELNNTESRKNELRRQLQSVRNDLRSEQEERKKLEEELSKMESENHLIMNKFKRVKIDQNISPIVNNQDVYDTPEVVKKSRQAFLKIDCQNTPSPLNADEFNKRIQNIQESNSPYFKVKKTSIGLAPILKNPKQQKGVLNRPPNKDVTKLSIFKKPRIAHESFPKLSSDIFYNGIGGTSKILQSDLTTNSYEK